MPRARSDGSASLRTPDSGEHTRKVFDLDGRVTAKLVGDAPWPQETTGDKSPDRLMSDLKPRGDFVGAKQAQPLGGLEPSIEPSRFGLSGFGPSRDLRPAEKDPRFLCVAQAAVRDRALSDQPVDFGRASTDQRGDLRHPERGSRIRLRVASQDILYTKLSSRYLQTTVVVGTARRVPI